MSPNDSESEDYGPAFYIPTIEAPTHYPRHITGSLRTRYDHLYRLHYQLKDLWHYQLKNHRDPWNIHAAYDFWRRHGTPRTLDGRKFGWDPERNWILDGIEDTENELADLEHDAKKRMRAISVVMGTHHQSHRVRARGRVSTTVVDAAATARSKSRLSAALDSAAAALSAVSASLNESQDMGFTSDPRYRDDAMGELDDQFLPTLDYPPCLGPSNFSYYDDYDIHDGGYYGDDGISGLPGSPEKPILTDDDDDDNKNREKGGEGDEEGILDYCKYFQEPLSLSPVSPSPVVSDNNDSDKNREDEEKNILHFLKHAQEEPVYPSSPVVDDNSSEDQDPFPGSLQDNSPSIMRLDRRRLRRAENSPEYIPGNAMMSKLYRDAETAAAPITTISDSDSDNDKDPSPESFQGLPLGRLGSSSEFLGSTFIREAYRDPEITAAPITSLNIGNSTSSSSLKTIQDENPISSNSSSPSKKRVRNEQEDDEEVRYLGEIRCGKSPKREADLKKQEEPLKIETISIDD